MNLPKPEPIELPPPNAVWLVISNAPDHETAKRIAHVLVEERLAACVNIMPACQSVYRWQGEIEEATEVPMFIKTSEARLARMQARLKELHPHEVPEMLAIKPQAGWPAYLDWVLAQTRPILRRK